MSQKWQVRLLGAFLVCALTLNIGQVALPASAMSEGNDQPRSSTASCSLETRRFPTRKFLQTVNSFHSVNSIMAF